MDTLMYLTPKTMSLGLFFFRHAWWPRLRIFQGEPAISAFTVSQSLVISIRCYRLWPSVEYDRGSFREGEAKWICPI